jgi:hypothetical protein
MRQLLANLDHEQYAVRQGATRELDRLGGVVEPALRRARTEGTSAEASARLGALLAKWDSYLVKDGETLRALRAVWVLERIGTPEAREILDALAHGAPGVRVTDEAEAALRRLDRPPARK